jgi:D-alanyl-D-alanine carboxypeptidase
MMLTDRHNERLKNLGITDVHIDACRLPAYADATNIINCGEDLFGRPLSMTDITFQNWQRMSASAKQSNITLQIVSAYRSIDYQCDLIQRKLASGRSIDDILQVNAIPGYSEHHTGRALDITTPGTEPLEESFELTDAFAWLVDHAAAFDFFMSYPKSNKLGIAYEPWHWTCVSP